MRACFSASLLLLPLALAGCIGNSSGTCDTGELCVCDGIGNCDQSCPDGDCNFVCRGIGNCNLDCEGGGCSVSCEGTGNCILACGGGDCDIHCRGTGNCICDTCSLPPDAGYDAGPLPEDAGTGVDGGGDVDGGTTDGGTTDGGTTDGGTTDGATTGDDPTCLDAVDCVLACGGPSPACIGQCNDGLTPDENNAFIDLETCIILACFGNGSCNFGGFDDPACVACRVDGQNDPAPLGCDDEALLCTG
jgi:hypothetical protein